MTRKEYLTAYRSVRKSSPTIIKSTMTQIRQAYITAAEKVADEIRVAQLSGMSDFTIKSWQNIDIQLNDSIGKISKGHRGWGASLSLETSQAVLLLLMSSTCLMPSDAYSEQAC